MAYPKIQYFKTPPGVPVGNLLQQSSEFDGSEWHGANSGASNPVVTPNVTADPNGEITGDGIAFPNIGAGDFSVLFQIVAVPANEPVQFTVWLKAAAPTTILLEISDNVSLIASQPFAIVPGWQSLSVSGRTNVGANQVQPTISPTEPSAAQTIYAWGAVLKCGTAMELPFKLPPINKPYVWQEAQRHDIFASGGEKQTTVERIDQFLAIEMPAIFGGDDADAWQDFLTWSIEGGEFQYFPDSDLDDSITCTVEETTAKLERKSYNVYSAKLTFRVAVP